jgi:hypothetical protein
VGSGIGWSALPAVTAVSDRELIAKLNTYPNLLLWLAGHRHKNTITALPSPDSSHPEYGFWGVETSSLREFPQEFRTIKVDRNSDNNISIYVTNVDPIVDGSLAAKSRTNAIAANQIFHGMPPATPGSYGTLNAELVKQLTPAMQAKIQKYGTPIK